MTDELLPRRTSHLLCVTVTDGLSGVQRVVSVLRLRGTHPQTITAWQTDEASDTWVLQHRLIGAPARVALLVRQLSRLPCTVRVTSTPGSAASTSD